MDFTVSGPSTSQVGATSTSLPEQTPAQSNDQSTTQLGWNIFNDYPNHSYVCHCSKSDCKYCIYNFEINPDVMEIERKLPTNRDRHGSDQIVKRINGLNGSMMRGVDLRHLPDWVNQAAYFMRKFVAKPTFVDVDGKVRHEPKALEFKLEERQNLVINEPFNMCSFAVPYSLGKRQRWQFNEHFEENPQEFQHPGHNITAILLTSDRLPEPSQIYAEQFPPLINGLENTKHRVRQMVAARPNGQIYTKETKTGRALPVDLLNPVEPISGPRRNQPKHKKAAKRFRRREMFRKRIECQEAPIRLVYFVEQPRPTPRQVQASAVREKFTGLLHGKKCPRSQKHRSMLIQDDDLEFYDAPMDFFNEETEDFYGYQAENEYEVPKPRGFSLVDFINEDIKKPSNHVLVQHPTSFNLIQMTCQKRSQSTGSVSSIDDEYELVDAFDFAN